MWLSIKLNTLYLLTCKGIYNTLENDNIYIYHESTLRGIKHLLHIKNSKRINTIMLMIIFYMW